MPFPNQFVEIDGILRKKYHVTNSNGISRVETSDHIEVEKLDIVEFDPLRPHKYRVIEFLFESLGIEVPDTSADDFIYMAGEHWINGEDENIGLGIALQLMSCPNSVYGNGGIGLTPFAFSSKKPRRKIQRFKSITRSMIPKEFTLGHSQYTHCFIDGPNSIDKIGRARKRSPEVGYNHLYKILNETDYPIQIPLIFIEAEPKMGTPEITYDFMNHYLTSLMMQPQITDEHVDLFRKGVNDLNRELADAETPISKIIDKNAINRLAGSFYRLNLKRKIDDSVFEKAVDYVITNIRDFETQFRGEILGAEGATYDRHIGYATERIPWHLNEDRSVFEVFAKLREIRENTGKAVSIDSLIQHFKLKTVRNALEILWNKGKVFRLSDGSYDIV